MCKFPSSNEVMISIKVLKFFFCNVGVWIWRAIFYVKATIAERATHSSESQLTNYKLQTREIMNFVAAAAVHIEPSNLI